MSRLKIRSFKFYTIKFNQPVVNKIRSMEIQACLVSANNLN